MNEDIETGPRTDCVAVLAPDYTGVRPRMRLQVGDSVKRGALLFEDGGNGGVRYTAPGAGEIKAINRGARRALQSVVIALSEAERTQQGNIEEVTYPAYGGKPVTELEGEAVKDLLLESGMWTALRRRPFEKVPNPAEMPRSIFVMACDSHPLSPAVDRVLDGQTDAWRAGLQALVKLAAGRKVYLCVGPETKKARVEIAGVEIHEIEGPHPAGTPGMAIHLVAPVDRQLPVWHVGYQDVVAIGHLMAQGRLCVRRIVSLAGPAVKQSRLLETRLGASVDTLVEGALQGEAVRVISGSVLHGREAKGDVWGYLGRYHNQIVALPEATERRMLGWLGPGFDRFSMLRLFAAKLMPWSKPAINTDCHGGKRVMVPLGLFEKVWPFDILATPLLRALLSDDEEGAEALGCLELAEEDLAVCSFVCPSKIDYGQVLRKMLDRIEEEG